MNEPTERQLRLKRAILKLARGRKVSAWSMLGRPKRLIRLARKNSAERQLIRQYAGPTGANRAAIHQAWKQWGILPSSYFRFRLFQADRAALTPLFLDYDETDELFEHLHRGRGPEAARDKYAFAVACAEEGLPCIPTLAYCRDGRIICGQAPLPPEDLFAKYTDESSGIGAQLWRYDGAYCCDDKALSSDGLLEHLRKASADQPQLLQPRLMNDPAMARLSNGALCTMRIVTGRMKQQVQVLFGILRMPTGRSFVDNFGAGGIAAPIDLATGRLGKAAQKALLVSALAHHPDTTEPIDGAVLPCWHDAADLCIKAHQSLFADSPTFGWDVAWTTGGLLLVETNPIWGIGLVQVAHDAPVLSNDSFVSFLEEYL